MKPKLLLGLALVLNGVLFGHFASAEGSAKPDQWHDFQIIPLITNANPSIRQPLLVQVPTRLATGRESHASVDYSLSVEIDKSSREETAFLGSERTG